MYPAQRPELDRSAQRVPDRTTHQAPAYPCGVALLVCPVSAFVHAHTPVVGSEGHSGVSRPSEGTSCGQRRLEVEPLSDGQVGETGTVRQLPEGGHLALEFE
jgi:hypothetical protein